MSGMLIRRPSDEVFRAFADPTVTTRFWFTRSSGPMKPGATLRWDWEMYGVSTSVRVKEVDDDGRILFEWNDENPTTVEFRFTAVAGDATFVEVTETGLSGDADQIVSHVAGSTGGFTIVLCAAKALLEHDLDLAAVRDRHPQGLSH
jgi:uncharacterized protein YndB with AHSA1/START domain